MAPPKKSTSSKPKQPTKIKRVKEVLFDEDARKEYLTGFSKRKKQRELAVRVKAIDKEREEKNESRRQVSHCSSFNQQTQFQHFFFPIYLPWRSLGMADYPDVVVIRRDSVSI
jgi:hypothetical protein